MDSPTPRKWGRLVMKRREQEIKEKEEAEKKIIKVDREKLAALQELMSKKAPSESKKREPRIKERKGTYILSPERRAAHIPYHFRKTVKFQGWKEEDNTWRYGKVLDPPHLGYPWVSVAPKLYMKLQTGGRFLVLNDYDEYNVLTAELVDRIHELVRKWDYGVGTYVCGIQSGNGNFSIGADFKTPFLLHKEKNNFDAFDELTQKRFQLNYSIATMETPITTILSGLTLGGGASLGLIGNCSAATESTMLSINEPSIGYIPDGGMTYILTRTGIRGLAEFLALTGYTMEGSDVYNARLSRYFFTEDTVEDAHLGLGKLYSDKISDALRALAEVHEPTSSSDFSLRNQLRVIGPCFDKDNILEIIEALENENTVFSRGMVARMRKASPLALHLTLRLIREAHGKSLEECMYAEHRVAFKLTRSKDFLEGIAARVMEHREPVWSHKSIEDVTKEEVDQFFKEEHPQYRRLELEALSNRPLDTPLFRFMQMKHTPRPLSLTLDRYIDLLYETMPATKSILDDEDVWSRDEAVEKSKKNSDIYANETQWMPPDLQRRVSRAHKNFTKDRTAVPEFVSPFDGAIQRDMEAAENARKNPPKKDPLADTYDSEEETNGEEAKFEGPDVSARSMASFFSGISPIDKVPDFYVEESPRRKDNQQRAKKYRELMRQAPKNRLYTEPITEEHLF